MTQWYSHNITMSAAAAQNVTFTKVEKGFKLQWTETDLGTTVTLVDKELPDSLTATTEFSASYRTSEF